MTGPPDQLPLESLAPRSPAPARTPEQLSLLGHPTPIRLPAELWLTWLTDQTVIARFEAKHYIRSPTRCWPWLGAVSSTGHGSFRAASLPGPSRRGTVPAHLFAYQLAHGVINRPGWSAAEDPVVCHTCDFHGCTNPAHLRLGTAAENRAEWRLRRHNPHGPLADVRGAAGRTRAIAQAIRAGLQADEPPDLIEKRIRATEAAGLPLTLW
ncbi:HNH endonuclease [Streptomyces olivochromogenes]|uniref:Uncharacterized protein n=1 Tax=Streptomyces olivochromogenes TaxID=1963 RepID=A0A250VW45_STROL|nr:HNH endonuclease [Streptomyces olivochromogenes]KUN33788.1 hypothetical protein AQJ27_49910 [Streptomyces olivochromogenes]GAX58351.1 hypothetical protein SO3561_09924 [Streptomyces olivochromogenes]